MALAIFNATFSLSRDIVDDKKGSPIKKPRSTLKENNPEPMEFRQLSVVSQVTILSDDENETIETPESRKISAVSQVTILSDDENETIETPESRKISALSQVTILSDDENESIEVVDTSQPSL